MDGGCRQVLRNNGILLPDINPATILIFAPKGTGFSGRNCLTPPALIPSEYVPDTAGLKQA
jgi:hypothetical protein